MKNVNRHGLLLLSALSLICLSVPSSADVTTVQGQDSAGASHVLKTDATGQLYIANPGSGGGGGTASSVSISDGTIGTRFLAVDAAGKIGINNFPSTFGVTGTFWQSIQPVSGSVSVSNFPSVFGISGSLPTGSNTIGNVGINGTVPVSGTFFQSTQPVSILTLPSLPTGSNTIGNVGVNNFPTNQTVVQPTGSNLHVVVDTAPTTAVTGTFFQTTQPISVSTLPLPTGAATSANQPGFGTSGSPSANVSTIQGIAGGTAVKTDGSAVTQPISGTVGVSGTVPVSGTFFQATQPISGAVSVSNLPATQTVAGSVSVSNLPATQAVSAASLPLPTGAATDTSLTNGNQKAQIVGSTGNVAVVDANGNQATLVSNIPIPPGLFQYSFVRATSTDAVLSGFFVDITGLQVGSAVTYTISTTGVTLTSLNGGTLPTGAVGFIGSLTQSVFMGHGGQVAGTITSGQTPATGYPQIPLTSYLTLGKVSQ